MKKKVASEKAMLMHLRICKWLKARNKKLAHEPQWLSWAPAPRGLDWRNEEMVSTEANGYIQHSVKAMSFASGQPTQCIRHESMLAMVD